MKKIKNRIEIILILSAALITTAYFGSGCSAFESAQETIYFTDTTIRDFSKSIRDISKSIDTVSRVVNDVNLTVRKLDTTINNSPKLIDDLIIRLDRIKLMINDVLSMADTTVSGVTGERTRRNLGLLRDELLGERTKFFIKNLLDALVGYEARQKLMLLLDELKAKLLDEVTMQKLAELREFLLGEQTTQMINTLMDKLSKNAGKNLREEINPALNSEIDFIQKRAYWLLTALVIAVCIVIWFINKSKEKYSKISKLLMYQISKLKDTPVFEPLKESISDNAKQIGMEDQLREILDENGILHLDKKNK